MGSSLIMDKQTGTRKRRRRGIGVKDVEDSTGLQPIADVMADIPSTSDGTVRNESNLHQSALLDELDEEINRQLKARKTGLTVNYVRNLIKAAMNTQYLLISNNLTLNVAGKISLKPILTRAKIRELLAKEYNLLMPKPLQTNDPDIAELITKELPDDSSDEEYHPNDASDDECKKVDEQKNEDEKIPSDKKESNDEPKPVTLNHANDLNTDENIGQRTRSKLCLSETPLEAIEQAFIPPDITKDMYNLECENPDWFDFLKEFTQPLNVVTQNPENIDDENDPEYSILDEDHEEALEELRMDSEVKVSKKELNALMKELWEYNQMICSDDDDDNRDEMSAKKRGIKEKLVNKDITDKQSTSFCLNNENESLLNNDKNENVDSLVQTDLKNGKEILLDNQNEKIIVQIDSNIENDNLLNDKNENIIVQIDSNNENGILLNDKNENIEVQIDSNNESNILLNDKNENIIVHIDSSNENNLLNNKNEVIEVIIKPEVCMFENQKLLFHQQLKQHIQMLVSYYLLTYKHPIIDGKYSNDYESMILFWGERIDQYECNKDPLFNDFMKHVIDLMKTWISVMNDPVQYKEITEFIKKQIEKVITYQKSKVLYRPELPPQMITVCKESRAFLYPLLLPSNGFVPKPSPSVAVSDSETMLLVIGWDEYNSLHFKVDPSSRKNFYEMIRYLTENKTPIWSRNSIQKFFKRSLESNQPNAIKFYYTNNKYPNINHYVIPLNPTILKLKQQSHQLMPEKWRTYLEKKM